MTLLLIIISVVLNCIAQLCMKKSMMGAGEITGGVQGLLLAIPTMIVNLYLWLSLICYALSILMWMVVLSRVDVSYAYPFLSIGYILSAIVGYYAFGENVTPIRIAGIIVICIGVVLISRS